MLILRKEQMDTLSDHMKAHFETRVVRMLEYRHPQHCEKLGRQVVLDRVHRAVDIAARYGILREYDVARFAVLCVLFDQGFPGRESYDWAFEILNRANLTPGAKITELDRQAATRLEAHEIDCKTIELPAGT